MSVHTSTAGLRPVFRDMGRRLAASGYVVLVVNPFYRSAKAPVVGATFNFNDPAQRSQVMGYRQAMTNAGVDKDAVAFTAFLDSQAKVSKKAGLGVQGYCMGGPLMIRTAAASPRVRAGASFHGGGLVTKTPDSPHLLVPKLRGRYLFDISENDDKSDPTAKDVLRTAFEAAKLPAHIEVFPGCPHGWTVPGSQAYNPAGAEKAWSQLLDLYKTALV